MISLAIIGNGGFAREVRAYYEEHYANQLSDYRVQHYEFENIKNIPSEVYRSISVIAIGNGTVRKKIVLENTDLEFRLLNYGKSYDHDTNFIGEGTIICPGTIITTNVHIGRHVIINLNCTIGHDCHIGNFVTISPGAHVSGNVHIGECCYIGTGAVIREKISICADAVIGAGAVVVKDIIEPGVYVGNPAKRIK